MSDLFDKNEALRPTDSDKKDLASRDYTGLSSEGAERQLDTVVIGNSVFAEDLKKIAKIEGFRLASPSSAISGAEKYIGNPANIETIENLKRLVLPEVSADVILNKTPHIEDGAILRNDGSAYGLNSFRPKYMNLNIGNVYGYGQDTTYETIDGQRLKEQSPQNALTSIMATGFVLRKDANLDNSTPIREAKDIIQADGGNVLSAPLKNGEPAVIIGEGNAFVSYHSMHAYNLFDQKQLEKDISKLRASNELGPDTLERNRMIEFALKKEFYEFRGGDDEIRSSLDPYRFEAEMNQLKEAYGDAFNTKPENITFVPQRFFHIDFMLRPGLNGQVFLESPESSVELIDSILSNPNNEEALNRKLTISKTNSHGIFENEGSFDLTADGEKSYYITERQLLDQYYYHALHDTAFERKNYPTLISRLEETGYDVVKVPGTFNGMTDTLLYRLTGTIESEEKAGNVKYRGSRGIEHVTNFMNGLMASNRKGEQFYITNSSPSVLLENEFEKILNKNGIEKVYFVGGGSTDSTRNSWEQTATGSLSTFKSGLDCQTLEIIKKE